MMLHRLQGTAESHSTAQHILRSVYGYKINSERLLKKTIKSDTEKLLLSMCDERISGKPVQYIVRVWEFRECIIHCEPPVFIPRPETEDLVTLIVQGVRLYKNENILSEAFHINNWNDAYLQEFKNGENKFPPKALHFLEIGSGTGAISISLAKAFNCHHQFHAIDINPKAAVLTCKNAALNNVKVDIQCCSFSQFLGNQIDKFDMIVSNPPYIPLSSASAMQKDILSQESPLALFSGLDGLELIREIIASCSNLLEKHGQLWLEIDPSQTTEITNICEKLSEIKLVSFVKDFQNLDRYCLIVRL